VPHELVLAPQDAARHEFRGAGPDRGLLGERVDGGRSLRKDYVPAVRADVDQVMSGGQLGRLKSGVVHLFDWELGRLPCGEAAGDVDDLLIAGLKHPFGGLDGEYTAGASHQVAS
jgi:hypothetical protein